MSAGFPHSTPAGIASTLAKRTAVNNARQLLKQVFVLDDILPLSFTPEPAWVAVRTRWEYVYKNLIPIESLTFENGQQIRRCLVQITGRD